MQNLELNKTTQIKIFQSSNKEIVEQQANEFMKDKNVTKVTHNIMQDFNDYNCWTHFITVTYVNVEINGLYSDDQTGKTFREEFGPGCGATLL